MKKIITAIITVALSISISNAQEKYVYNNSGALKYIVSDKVLVSVPNQNVGYFMKKTYTNVYQDRTGLRVGYNTNQFFRTKIDGGLDSTIKHSPVLFRKEIDLNSMLNLIAFLKYVKDVEPDRNTTYYYSDNTLELMLRVEYKYMNELRLYYESTSYNKYSIDELLKALQSIESKFLSGELKE